MKFFRTTRAMIRRALASAIFLCFAAASTRALVTPPTGAIAAGNNHLITLKSDGTVWTWGSNDSGQLGDGTTTLRTAPVQGAGVSGMVAVAGGMTQSFTAGLKSDGTVWAWGNNSTGQLGDGTTSQRTIAVQATGVGGMVALSAGGSHIVALKSDGTVWAWGKNSSGQLGDGTTTQRLTAVQVIGLSGIVAVAAGGNHTAALKSDGTVWAWGTNSSGQLGDGTTVNKSTAVQVSGLTSVVAIAANSIHTVALKSDGTVWAWGANSASQLGDGTATNRNIPVQVLGVSGAVAIAAGNSHTVALLGNGTVFAWGQNINGQLGDGTLLNRSTAIQMSGVSGAAAIAAGGGFTMVLKTDGSVWVTGANGSGQLGNGTSVPRTSAIQVGSLTSVTALATGASHTVVLRSDGTVWTCGSNDSGQLGDGTITNRAAVAQVSNLTGIISVNAGSSFTVALKNDGTVWTWGANASGQLGDATNLSRTTPVPVNGLAGIVAVATGVSHTLAIKSDGTVWTWGLNASGQLGDSTAASRSTPVQMSGVSGATMVAGGGAHTVVLKSDGTVWTSGGNSNGQLGDGTTTSKTTAAQVTALSGVVAVAAGNFHTIALKNDGTIWAWGLNSSGQVGDGTTVQRTVPVQVSSLTGIIRIAAGNTHSVAIKNDGTAWAWGTDDFGQLGDGTAWPLRPTPVQMIGVTGATAVDAGQSYTVVLRNDQTLRGWGDNGVGQLGYPNNRGIAGPAAIRLTVSGSDANQNGMSDTWEMQYFGNLTHPGGGDTDNDGLTDVQEAANGSDPTQDDTDGDLLSDFVDAYPNDYYNGVAPAFTIVSGNNQTALAATFNPQPLDVAVWNSGGVVPLVNAPVTFTVSQGGGSLATTNLGSPALAQSISLRTDPDGTAQAYYKQPSGSGVSSQILVTAGAAQVTFQTQSSPAATVTLGNLSQTYDGLAHSVTATTSPAGLSVSFTYNGSSTAPTNAGSYAVVATVTDPGYTGSTTGTLTISKATPTISWSTPAPITYGTPLSGAQLNASAGVVGGAFVYAPSTGTVLPVGTQPLSVTFTPSDSTNYTTASGSAVLTVNPVSVSTSTSVGAVGGQTYSATAQTLSVSATVSGTTSPTTGSVAFALKNAGGATIASSNGSVTNGAASATLTIPAATPAGSGYLVTANYAQAAAGNYVWSASSGSTSFSIGKAIPVVTWAAPTAITYGILLSATQLNASANVAGTSFVYTPALGAVLNAGPQSLSVVFTPTDTTNYQAVTATTSLLVNKATAVLTLVGLEATADGTPKVVTATTVPANLPVTVTYNGNATAPITAGSYPNVVGTVVSPNYQGTVTGTLTISPGLPSGYQLVMKAPTSDYLGVKPNFNVETVTAP